MLTLERLRFTRGDYTLNADWSLPRGSRCAVLGPSGGGKSTLLSLIAGFEPPAAGRIWLAGVDITGQSPGARPISTVFQETNLFPHLSVSQNVGLGLTPARLSAAQADAVTDVLRAVELAAFADRKPGALSGGQRARVALARVLLRERPLLLLDEAFSALGPALKNEMFALLESILSQTGATVLMVTHDPEEAALMDQIIVVEGGKAHAPQPAGPILADPPPALAAYLGR